MAFHGQANSVRINQGAESRGIWEAEVTSGPLHGKRGSIEAFCGYSAGRVTWWTHYRYADGGHQRHRHTERGWQKFLATFRAECAEPGIRVVQATGVFA